MVEVGLAPKFFIQSILCVENPGSLEESCSVLTAVDVESQSSRLSFDPGLANMEVQSSKVFVGDLAAQVGISRVGLAMGLGLDRPEVLFQSDKLSSCVTL